MLKSKHKNSDMTIHTALQTPFDVRQGLAARAKARRLELNISQAELAERSGMSVSSLRRFEATGDISLASVLELALVLGELKEFDRLFLPLHQASLFDKRPRVRLRSRKKAQPREDV